jgi:pimeloyl-ACP methyl ester carboxylesterase
MPHSVEDWTLPLGGEEDVRQGTLQVPPPLQGLVVFVHGSGSSRLSPRNSFVADALGGAGFATLLFDLLAGAEGEDRRNVFDIPLLADRTALACTTLRRDPRTATLPLGLFGPSTGAAAALVAATTLGDAVRAIISRGGSPDLAGCALASVRAPTLLLVGGEDRAVLALNRAAAAAMRGKVELMVVPGASHLFEEPGALAVVTRHAVSWFRRWLAIPETAP